MSPHPSRLEGHELARRSIALHSKSFALASRLLPADVRDDAVILYAYCRRADDAIDLAAREDQPKALAALREELDSLYAGESQTDPLLRALQALLRERELPRAYPDELVEGMAMDVRGATYPDESSLLQYCYRVASTVGLMMCHVMGVREDRALPHAAHLGIGMQLTNICRDVAEDWQSGRLYLPDSLLTLHGAPGLRRSLGQPLPDQARAAIAATVADLLDLADRYYASGDAGLGYLSPQCATAVSAAGRIYADIGRVVRAQGCDPLSGRARVSGPRKAWLAVRASVDVHSQRRRRARPPVRSPSTTLPFSQLLTPETP